MLEQPAMPINNNSMGLAPRFSPGVLQPSMTTVCPVALLATKQLPSTHCEVMFMFCLSSICWLNSLSQRLCTHQNTVFVAVQIGIGYKIHIAKTHGHVDFARALFRTFARIGAQSL